MARVKLVFPESNPIFQTTIPVRITDINYGNHLANDKVLGIAHEARVQWLKSLFLSEMDIGGCALIMADAMLRYQRQAYHGDVLNICLYPDHVAERSFDLLYRMTVSRQGAEEPIAVVKTAMVAYDYRINKVKPIPEAFRKILSEYK